MAEIGGKAERKRKFSNLEGQGKESEVPSERMTFELKKSLLVLGLHLNPFQNAQKVQKIDQVASAETKEKFKVGDLIYSINKKPCETQIQLKEAWKSVPVGGVAICEIERKALSKKIDTETSIKSPAHEEVPETGVEKESFLSTKQDCSNNFKVQISIFNEPEIRGHSDGSKTFGIPDCNKKEIKCDLSKFNYLVRLPEDYTLDRIN
mmetsp:Transcript_12840/g.16869  ORF Transcript_12840/g.16869 Transcript_12840/m.16869 type:complete len:207 (+) Transcript_12840:187-807(+)